MNRIALHVLAVAASLFTAAASAAPSELKELPIRNERYHVSYVINADGSHYAVLERAVKILKQSAVESFKQANLSYSTSVERAEVLDAYTRKPDGRRIDAPKSNFQLDINKGHESGPPAFSDRTRMTVIFPDVAVGDVVVLKYKVTDIEPMFPGHFSIDERLGRNAAFDDVVVRLEAPESLWLQYSANAMTRTVDETRDGRRILEWTWKNPAPARSKRRDWSAYDPDKEPGYAISTFRDYAAIAEAYGARARPKAVATARVRALADEVTKGISTPRDQVKALYEWVATNIDFAGNCVGVGAVVPRDQEFVLDNKMGDCKDHATLLQAMLAAKGIASSQALVNSGSTYHLPKVPVISMVNHVILYVPSLGLFLDSTSKDTPFGMLPFADCDKPVLLVDGYKEGLRTPVQMAAANGGSSRTELTMKGDGSVAGTVKVSVKGNYAVSGRSRLRDMSAEQRDEMFEQMYKRDRATGFGKLEGDDPKPLLDSFSYKVTFETEEFADVPGPGAFTINPVYPVEASIAYVAQQTEEEPEAEETVCSGGDIVEEYVYHLPKGMKIIAVPKNVTAKTDDNSATYRATYVLAGDTLTVKRALTDRTERNVCPVAMQREYARFARKIATDLKAQVVYQ